MPNAIKELGAHIKTITGVVREYVENKLVPVQRTQDEQATQIKELQARIAALTETVEALKQAPEPAVDEAKIAQQARALIDLDAVAKEAAALVPVPEIPEIDLDALAKEAAALVPVPEVKHGRDGEPGRDAANLEILPVIDPDTSYPRNTYARHAGGLWRSFQQTTGMHGWECVVRGVADMRAELVDERTVVVKMRVSDGEVDEFRATLPVVIDRGTYKATQTYETGDGITYGGQYWIAQKDGPTGKPGEPGSDGWRLAVRKGRDASNTAKLGGTGK